MKHLRPFGLTLATIFALTAFTACGAAEDESGVCIAPMGSITECFDCWKKELCEEQAFRTWNSGAKSCAELGYSRPTSNTCGYTS